MSWKGRDVDYLVSSTNDDYTPPVEFLENVSSLLGSWLAPDYLERSIEQSEKLAIGNMGTGAELPEFEFWFSLCQFPSL